MSYNVEYLNMVSSGKNRCAPVLWIYANINDTLTTVSSSDYFSDAKIKFALSDWIFINASDGSAMCQVSELSPLVTITNFSGPTTGQLTTNEITFANGTTITSGSIHVPEVPPIDRPAGSLFLNQTPWTPYSRVWVSKGLGAGWAQVVQNG